MKQNKTERLQAEVSKIRKIKISSRGRTPDGGPNPIDTHVGNRIRLRRQLLGKAQRIAAQAVGGDKKTHGKPPWIYRSAFKYTGCAPKAQVPNAPSAGKPGRIRAICRAAGCAGPQNAA